VLKWARENHCPWDSYAREAAVFGDHPEVLQWLDEHGCPLEVEGIENSHEDVSSWSSANRADSEEEEDEEEEEEEEEEAEEEAED
jgi:hypothetical protein